MEYIKFCSSIIFAIFIYMVIAKVLMEIADKIGEFIGLKKLIELILSKIFRNESE